MSDKSMNVDPFSVAADEEKAATALLERNLRQRWLEREALAAIENVQQRFSIDAAQLNVNRAARVSHDVADQFGVDQLRGKTIVSGLTTLGPECGEKPGTLS